MIGRLFTAAQLSELCHGCPSEGTLANWRSAGIGPRYIKQGHVILYSEAAVIDWIAANTKDTSPTDSDGTTSRRRTRKATSGDAPHEKNQKSKRRTAA